MMQTLVLALVAATLLHGLRTWLLYRPLAARNHESFAGEMYQVGDSVVAYRPAQGGTGGLTVIAAPGFLEDTRYFSDLYEDPMLELILVNNSGYHCPDRSQTPHPVRWGKIRNPYEIGSIEHDAFVFNLAFQHLSTGKRIRAHGHSRGGAVILEAIKQAPERFQNVEVILEAPVLPGGKGHPALELAFSALGRYLLPINFTLLRYVDLTRFGKWIFAPLTPRKAELVKGFYFAPKTFDIVIKNLNSMQQWIAARNTRAYAPIQHGTILIGERDLVLDRAAMLRSAQLAKPRWHVIETRGTSHFVSLDQPGLVPRFIEVPHPPHEVVSTTGLLQNEASRPA